MSKVDGSGLHRSGAIGTRPDWSPDGTRLAVDTSTLGVDGSIFVVNLKTGDTRRVETVGKAPYGAEWSSDGTKILYLSPWGATEDQEVRVVDLASGVDTRLRRADSSLDLPWGGSASWSPDGRRVAYECDTGVCAMRPDASHMQMLTCCPMNVDHGTLAPQWSPDGAMIEYWCDAVRRPAYPLPSSMSA